ncbi:MAG: arabinogalactan endo-1,4-beta-galactosidase [Bacteroidales bacterium]|nr:arabinogalactan endo-1,4-beta-galactosidase [Bacteroidales bacterium]
MPEEYTNLVSSVDISAYPEILKSNLVFHSFNGQADDLPDILKDCGVNTIRIRLWHTPQNEHSGLEEVRQFTNELKTLGFNIWLSVHYSDTWADPSQQNMPEAWQNISYNQLKDSVAEYTRVVMNEINPDIIQVGNEVNSGFLHPHGHINSPDQFAELLMAASEVIREQSASTKIMIHFAGFKGSDWFYSLVDEVDYDFIGLSYYPIWHGENLGMLESTMKQLNSLYQKKVLIAETAYPFTLGWNDWTNNIVGTDEQLILPDYPASELGQKLFVEQIKLLSTREDYGGGFSYWGGELVAWKGKEATDGSPWENQALFDFNNNALPALKVFDYK